MRNLAGSARGAGPVWSFSAPELPLTFAVLVVTTLSGYHSLVVITLSGCSLLQLACHHMGYICPTTAQAKCKRSIASEFAYCATNFAMLPCQWWNMMSNQEVRQQMGSHSHRYNVARGVHPCLFIRCEDRCTASRVFQKSLTLCLFAAIPSIRGFEANQAWYH